MVHPFCIVSLEKNLLTILRDLLTILELIMFFRPDSSGISTYKFASDINPLEQSCWMLSPIRKVLDVCEKDGYCSFFFSLLFSGLWSQFFVTFQPFDCGRLF